MAGEAQMNRNMTQLADVLKSAARMKFESYLIADISTGYLEESDLDLIGPGSPNHLATIDPLPGDKTGTGDFFYVSDADLQVEFEQQCTGYGLSERFITIMRELRQQGFQYVRFDADGGHIDGMKLIDEE